MQGVLNNNVQNVQVVRNKKHFSVKYIAAVLSGKVSSSFKYAVSPWKNVRWRNRGRRRSEPANRLRGRLGQAFPVQKRTRLLHANKCRERRLANKKKFPARLSAQNNVVFYDRFMMLLNIFLCSFASGRV